MTPLNALNEELALYMDMHAADDDWPGSLRALDVTGYCADLALDAYGDLDPGAMMDARITIALWIDDNEQNRPARFQLTEYLESL